MYFRILFMIATLATNVQAQTFQAGTVDFSRVAGQIDIRFTQADRIKVSPRSDGGAQLKATLSGAVLSLQLAAPRMAQSRADGQFINSAVGPGAVAIQNIPGQSSVRTGEGIAPVVVEVPAGTLLKAAGFAGSARIVGNARQVDISVASGEVRLAQVDGGRLQVSGAGSVHVGQASGDLDLELLGAGEIVVDGGQVRRLGALLGGAGEIRFGGTATTARCENSGAGEIFVHRVLQQPVVINKGAGDIVIERRG